LNQENGLWVKVTKPVWSIVKSLRLIDSKDQNMAHLRNWRHQLNHWRKTFFWQLL